METGEETTDRGIGSRRLLLAAPLLAGLAVLSGTLVVFATGGGKERRIRLAGLAMVSGALSALLLIPTVAYVVIVLVNDREDPAFWEMGRIALVTTSLGIVGLGAAAYERWLVAITDARRRGGPGDHAGP